jgi:ABC-type dipeptide/oligopeptide/nickel transport system permease subunit
LLENQPPGVKIFSLESGVIPELILSETEIIIRVIFGVIGGVIGGVISGVIGGVIMGLIELQLILKHLQLNLPVDVKQK